MKFSKEMIEQAKELKSVEELLSFAKENGIEYTKDEAEEYFAKLHKSGELADDELDNVAGGCGLAPCSRCGSSERYPYGGLKYVCVNCGHIE